MSQMHDGRLRTLLPHQEGLPGAPRMWERWHDRAASKAWTETQGVGPPMVQDMSPAAEVG